MQTDTSYPHPTTQSDPDSQTAQPQARNSASGCNAATSLHQSIGSATGTADVHSDRPAHPFQTTPGGVFIVPEEIAVLARDADFVAVEVVGLLAIFAVFVGPVAYLCQGVVAVVL